MELGRERVALEENQAQGAGTPNPMPPSMPDNRGHRSEKTHRGQLGLTWDKETDVPSPQDLQQLP